MARTKKHAQAAIEYLLIMGATVALVLGGFNYWLNFGRNEANLFFNRQAADMMGNAPVTREFGGYP